MPSNPNVPASDRMRVMATIDPDAYTAAAYTSDWVDASLFDNILAVAMVGTMQATSTVDVALKQATDSSGTGAKAITGKSATQLTAAGSDSDKQVVLEVRPEELDLDNSFTHVALVITVGTADSDAGGIVFGVDARKEPETDLASVDEIVY